MSKEEEKTETEPDVEETKVELAKKKRAKQTHPASPYLTPEESEKSEENEESTASSDDYVLSSSEIPEG